VFTGAVEDSDLPIIYNIADAFVLPSLYEGFGLPVLEAMACGVPVITSKAGSLSEISGDAAVLIEPDDLQGLTEAMQHVLEDTAFQKDIKRLGLVHASTFSWEKCARETLSVYQQILLCKNL